MYLVTTWFGSFLLTDAGEVEEARVVPGSAEAVAERLQALEEGEVLEVERELAPASEFHVSEERLLVLEGAVLAAEGTLPQVAPEDHGVDPSLLREAGMAHAKARTRDELARPDRHVVHGVNAVDDLLQASNLLTERLREWFALHFPELPRATRSPEELVSLIARFGSRGAIVEERPDLEGDEGVGGPLDEATQEVLQELARAVSTLNQSRGQIGSYLDEKVPTVAPNVTTLVGAEVAARLVRHAGGLEALAKLPSGTVQTLGAEKALFRHLREGADPPKHGVLYQVPMVHRAPPDMRGSIARALAGKLTLAARADAFTGRDIGEELLKQVEARVEEIRRQRRKS